MFTEFLITVFVFIIFCVIYVLPVLGFIYFCFRFIKRSKKRKKSLDFGSLSSTSANQTRPGRIVSKDVYEQSSYFKTTGRSYYTVVNDKGLYGEYRIYEYLKEYEQQGGKFLFNVYIPKWNGETTEIDVVLICESGVFIFESKNVSGHIFGTEDDRKWVQVLFHHSRNSWVNEANYFYNPVIQNGNHIRYIRKYIGFKIPIHSVVCFSERCNLQIEPVHNHDVKVIKRYDVKRVVDSICLETSVGLLGQEEIDNIYNQLLPFTNVDESVKLQHTLDAKRYKQQ